MPTSALGLAGRENSEASEPPISAIWQTDRVSVPFGIPVGNPRFTDQIFLLTRAAFLFTLFSQLAAMDEDGAIHMNPNFLAQIRQEFPNSMSRILIACDDGTFRSEKAAAAIVDKCGFTQVKIIDGGIDGYLAAFPLSDADKVKWRMRPEIGEDLSVLVSGVDTRQQGQKYY